VFENVFRRVQIEARESSIAVGLAYFRNAESSYRSSNVRSAIGCCRSLCTMGSLHADVADTKGFAVASQRNRDCILSEKCDGGRLCCRGRKHYLRFDHLLEQGIKFVLPSSSFSAFSISATLHPRCSRRNEISPRTSLRSRVLDRRSRSSIHTIWF